MPINKYVIKNIAGLLHNVDVPVQIKTFEQHIGHGTPWHKYVVTIEDDMLTYHAFLWGKTLECQVPFGVSFADGKEQLCEMANLLSLGAPSSFSCSTGLSTDLGADLVKGTFNVSSLSGADGIAGLLAGQDVIGAGNVHVVGPKSDLCLSFGNWTTKDGLHSESVAPPPLNVLTHMIPVLLPVYLAEHPLTHVTSYGHHLPTPYDSSYQMIWQKGSWCITPPVSTAKK